MWLYSNLLFLSILLNKLILHFTELIHFLLNRFKFYNFQDSFIYKQSKIFSTISQKYCNTLHFVIIRPEYKNVFWLICSGKDQKKYTSGWCSNILYPLHPSSSVVGGTELSLRDTGSNPCKGVLTLLHAPFKKRRLKP